MTNDMLSLKKMSSMKTLSHLTGKLLHINDHHYTYQLSLHMFNFQVSGRTNLILNLGPTQIIDLT